MKILRVAFIQGTRGAKAHRRGAPACGSRFPGHWFLAPLAVLCLGLCAIPPAHALTLTGRVVTVDDGDRITVAAPGEQPFQVRLFGVAAPRAGQAFDEDARTFTKKAVLGKEVRVVVEAFRRGEAELTGTVLVGDRNLNEALVRNGYAWWYRREAPRDASLKQLEAEARTAKYGLWAGRSPVAPWVGEARERPYLPPRKRPVRISGQECCPYCLRPLGDLPTAGGNNPSRRRKTNLNDLAPP